MICMKNIQLPRSELYKSTDLDENPILRYCVKSSKSIADISKKFDIKRSTLVYYLNILKKQGIINIKRIQSKKTGRPSLIKTDLKKIEDLKKKEKANSKKLNGYKPIEYEVLKVLKQKGKPLSESEVSNDVANNHWSSEDPPYYVGINKEHWDNLDDQDKAEYTLDTGTFDFLMNKVRYSFNQYIDVKFSINQEGKEYLKKYKDKHLKTIRSNK